MDSKLKCVFEMPVEENAMSATNQELNSLVEDNKTKRVGDSVSTRPALIGIQLVQLTKKQIELSQTDN